MPKNMLLSRRCASPRCRCPSGSTVTSPPPTSETSRLWSSMASPTESSTTITPTPSEKPSRRKSERSFRTHRWRKARVSSISRGCVPSSMWITRAASRGEPLVVRHHDERGAVGIEASEEVEDLLAGGRVELAGGLVGEEDRRPVGERAGDRHPLHLAAGELRRPVLRAVSEPDVREQLAGARPALGARRRRPRPSAARRSRAP